MDVIPLFPLGTPLFPGVVLPLQVFEPRYRRLVRDLLERPEGSTRCFGVVAIRQGWEVEEVAPAEALYDVGCTARLQTVRPQSDGVDRIVTVGVDTHSDIHVAVALDQLGRRLGATTIPATPQGYRRLEAWARQFGRIEAFGIEGTGSWGAGLVRQLREHGHRLVEVNRPDRGARHRQGKNDPLDAEAAARAVLERPG